MRIDPPPLPVTQVERFSAGHLLDRLRDTRLTGDRDVAPYRDASLELVSVAPDALAPAQRYVLTPGVETILALRTGLLPHGVDLFALDGGALVRLTSDDEQIPVIPPIVEESVEPDGRTVLLIADGLHRVYAARTLGMPVTVVVVRGVPSEYPYYALALPEGWKGVAPLNDLPDGFQKKEYRVPDNYKSLFRDFNAQFPGVQKDRKKSNPAHLRA